MKILYAVTKSERGGAQTYVQSLARAMRDRGHDVCVMSDGVGWLHDVCQELRIPHETNRYFKNSYSPINAMRAYLRARAIIQQWRPDIVHANSGGAGFFARVAALGLGARVVFTAHGWSFRVGVPIVQRIVGWIVEWKLSWITDHTICVSNHDKQVGERAHVARKRKTTVVHNGTEIPDSPAARDLSDDKVTVIFAGRYAAPKRQDLMIRALASVPKVHLVCAGEGPRKPDLKKLAKRIGVFDRITFGAHENMSDAYHRADIAVLVSNYEGFPMTIIEAMAHGLPVIANGVGGIPEAVTAETGICLPKGPNETALVQALKKLTTDPTYRHALGDAGRHKAMKEFSVATMVDKTVSVYERVLS